MAKEKMTHADKNLTDCFVAYLVYKKENEQKPLATLDLNVAIMTALGGLDEEYSCGDYLMKMKADFERIALILEEMAKRQYKDLAMSEGKKDKLAKENMKYYSVFEAAQYHHVAEETIRKAIRENRLKAEGKPYRITESDVKNFSPKSWHKRE